MSRVVGVKRERKEGGVGVVGFGDQVLVPPSFSVSVSPSLFSLLSHYEDKTQHTRGKYTKEQRILT